MALKLIKKLQKKYIGLFLCIFLFCLTGFAEDQRVWSLLEKDGAHDPNNPAITLKQEPKDALKSLVPDLADVGNQVKWVDSLNNKLISPRMNILSETKVKTLDMDIIMSVNGSQPIVKFPHIRHTVWLDCTNCHDSIFKPKYGSNDINMLMILSGEQCGVCHGAVAFPLTECFRCHSIKKDSEEAKKILTTKNYVIWNEPKKDLTNYFK